MENNSRFNVLYDLEEDTNEGPDYQQPKQVTNDLNQAAHLKERNAQRKEEKKKNQIPDLNEMEVINEINLEKDTRLNQETENLRREGLRVKPNQAAAESEHVVVRGQNKGKNISRTVIEDNEDIMDVTLPGDIEEHHQDPAYQVGHDDVMMVETEHGGGEYSAHECLAPGIRVTAGGLP